MSTLLQCGVLCAKGQLVHEFREWLMQPMKFCLYISSSPLPFPPLPSPPLPTSPLPLFHPQAKQSTLQQLKDKKHKISIFAETLVQKGVFSSHLRRVYVHIVVVGSPRLNTRWQWIQIHLDNLINV